MKAQALLLNASALALPWSGMADAQTPPSADKGPTIETVAVTAEHRSENLMTTAISAGVLTVQDIANKGVVTVDSLPFIAPAFAFDVSAQYKFDLGDGDSLTPRVNCSHMAEQWATMFDQPQFGACLAPRDILGAQLEWRHDTYAVTLCGTNLTDQHDVANMFSGLNSAGPQQFGVRLMKAF